MSPAKFLDDIKAKFATPEEYAAAVDAVGEIMRERAAAYERGQADMKEKIAKWRELRAPECSGPEYRLASEDQRRTMREQGLAAYDDAALIRAIPTDAPSP